MNRLFSSTASYVVAALLLSGQVLANPADLSGSLNKLNDGQTVEQSFYLAFNRYSVDQPKISIDRLPTIESFRSKPVSEVYLDGLQIKLRHELDSIIESRGL